MDRVSVPVTASSSSSRSPSLSHDTRVSPNLVLTFGGPFVISLPKLVICVSLTKHFRLPRLIFRSQRPDYGKEETEQAKDSTGCYNSLKDKLSSSSGTCCPTTSPTTLPHNK